MSLSTDPWGGGKNTILTSLEAQRKSFHSHFFFTPLKVMAFLTSCNQHAHSPKVPFNTVTQNCCVTHFGLLCAIIIRHHSPGLPGSRRLSARAFPRFSLPVDSQLHAWEMDSISLHHIHPHLRLISCLDCDYTNRAYRVSPSYTD